MDHHTAVGKDGHRQTHSGRKKTRSQLCRIVNDDVELLVDGAVAPPSGQMFTYSSVLPKEKLGCDCLVTGGNSTSIFNVASHYYLFI